MALIDRMTMRLTAHICSCWCVDTHSSRLPRLKMYETCNDAESVWTLSLHCRGTSFDLFNTPFSRVSLAIVKPRGNRTIPIPDGQNPHPTRKMEWTWLIKLMGARFGKSKSREGCIDNALALYLMWLLLQLINPFFGNLNHFSVVRLSQMVLADQKTQGRHCYADIIKSEYHATRIIWRLNALRKNIGWRVLLDHPYKIN